MLARLFVLIGGLIVLALTVALVGPYFIDWTNYRGDFEREASAVLGRKVTVRGDATARILPFPSVTFEDVVVGEGAAGQPAMTVEQFSMDAELAPFMRGEFLIFDMRLVRPKVTVTVAGDGTIDWAVRPSTPFAARDISLERLSITEGQVRLRHATSGREHLLSEVNMDASARSLVGPWRIDGTLRVDGQQAALAVSTGTVGDDGALRLRLRGNPALYPVVIEADGDVRMDNGAATYAGTFKVNAKEDVTEELRGTDGKAAKKGDREPQPGNRLAGAFTLDHKRLAIDEFRFETGPLNDPYVADGKAFVELGAEPRFSITADGAQVRFDAAEETASTPAGQTLERRLAQLRDALLDLPKPAIPGTVEVNLPAIVAGDTMIRDVRLSAEPNAGSWTIKSLAAVLPGRTTVEASGVLRAEDELDFKGKLLVAVAQPSGFVAWLSKDVDEAIRRLPGAGFSADVDLTPSRQSFKNLELQLGGARLKGELDSQRPPDRRPSMLVRLDGGAVDMDGLAAMASLFISDKGASRFGDTDLDLALKAGPVAALGLSAGTLDTAMRLREGTVEIDRLSIGDLAGATVSATGRVSDFPVKPTGNLDASIVSVDLQPLLDAVAARFPDQPFVRALRERGAAYAGLYADSEINVVASATDAGGEPVYALHGQGTAGGTTFTATYTGAIGDPDADIVAGWEGRNGDATALLALYGLNTLPLGLTGPGQMELTLAGTERGGLKTALSFTGDGTAAHFEGSSTRGEQGLSVKGQMTLDASDIEPWLMTTGLALPGMGMGTGVGLKAELDYASGLLVVSGLDGTVAEGAVAGDVNLAVKDGIPHLSGQLALDELDLQPFARMVLGEGRLEGDGGGWATQPFQQKSTAPFTADLDLTAGSLAAGPVATASDARLELRLDAEGLRVADLSGKFGDGTLSGLFELKNNDGTALLTAQLKLGDADVSRLVEGIALEGRGDVSTTLSASGKTMDGLVAALSGSGTAALRDLVIPGINPDAFPAIIAEADRIGRDIDAPKTAAFAPALAAGGHYGAGSLDAAFTVAGGVLRVPPLNIANPAATLSAEMRADLNDGTVAADGALTYAAGDQALVGSEPSLRFAVAGMPGSIGLTFDSAPLAQFLTQRALEIEQARVEAMQADLLEKQRLRREVRYYAALQADRDRLAEEQRRAEEMVRQKVEEAARLKTEEEARAKAEEQARLDAEAEAKRAAEDEATRAAEDARKRRARNAAAPEQAPAASESPPSGDDFDTSAPAEPQPRTLRSIIESLGN